MKKVLFFTLALTATVVAFAQKKPANIKLTEATLMHESRATPSLLDKATVDDRFVSFQWPLPTEAQSDGAPMDGFEHLAKKIDKSKLAYKIRYAQDSELKKGLVEADTRWPFYNPEKQLTSGIWYWQYGYVGENGQVTWSKVLQVTVGDNKNKFCPPSYKELIAKVPQSHPRVWVQKGNWDKFIAQTQSKAERQWYLDAAQKVLRTPMKTVKDINTSQLKNLTNEMQRNSYLTRESRRIIDAEEGNTEALIRSYLLTKDRKYADEAIRRVFIMMDWDKNANVKGDFNASALLSLCSMAYDSFYDLLTDAQKKQLLEAIKEKGTAMYDHFNNYLENHIAENHIWQMTLRILEKPRDFDPFGQTGLSPLATI